MKKPVLLDTGCLVALLDRGERRHRDCVNAVDGLEAPLVTCEAVIAESCYLLRGVKGAPEAILANVEKGIFQIPFRLENHTARLKYLIAKYRQVPMDFADACLVCLGEELKTGLILTLDKDFLVYRWAGNKPFENLLADSV